MQKLDGMNEVLEARAPEEEPSERCIAPKVDGNIFLGHGEVDGYTPTNKPVVEIASAVYRVENEKIVEYWIQIDREGIRIQLERNKE